GGIMKRSWYPSIILGVVIGLLTLFLGLQYRWLSEVGDANRERMQKRAETDAGRLAEDFNREMHAAYFNFQTPAETWNGSDWSEFNERYEFWKGRTTHPDLIRDIYFFPKQADSKPLRYDPDRRAFDPSDSNETLDALRAKFSDDSQFRPVYADEFAMVLPIFNGEKRREDIIIRRSGPGAPPAMNLPERVGWVVVLLDSAVIKERILPELASKYFPEHDFKVAVIDDTGQRVFATADVATPDASVRLFDMSPDNLMFFAGHTAIRKRSPDNENIVLDQRVESHTFTRSETKTGQFKTDDGGTFTVQLKRPGPEGIPRVATLTGPTPGSKAEPWTLQVQNAAGSIDAYIDREENKSMMIGLGIYLLLIGSITAIVLSAMKSKMFAQRQIDFVSSVSHEFRTPLAVIYSAGENLADGVAKEDGQVARYGELIKGEGKKLTAMVEQILEFAGSNSARRKFNFARTEVRELVRDAVKQCQPLIDSGGFSVEEAVAEKLPPISVDRSALSSAIQNLIANSVKYSNGSKWIRVSAVNGGDAVRISVEDRGIGIAGDELKRIFEPFYRSKDVVDSQISGNGLGLNLVQKIVDAHSGKVTVESKPGEGSTFTIELPV
ncbi:MAG TPA: HAMP domain-containing sensor histidine kinase, partial [Pyrinomonadaceae bacterium]|nr:HAMP domain-containing sensor histidine kinase [Pyrinomonadaceae bacterium]